MKFIFSVLIFLLSFASCDILRNSVFEVSSWTPGEGYHPEPEEIAVSLEFSHVPDKSSVERGFNFMGDGNRVRGNFEWDGNRVTFIPLTPLEKNIDYTISLSADTRNTYGLSMDSAFYSNFTTRAADDRPEVVSCYPSMYSETDNLKTEVILEFSLPVTLKTLYENISFTPSMTGIWNLDDERKIAVFTPAEQWSQNNRYEIYISISLTDLNGMNIRNDFTSVFTTGTDREAPSLISAHRITDDNKIIELSPDRGFSGIAESPVINSNWEKNDRLLLIFSKPVDVFTVRNSLNTENGPSLTLETFPGFETEIIFKPENIPVYESVFTLILKPGIKDRTGNETKEEYFYRICANGEFSKPPKLAGIRIPMSPGNDAEREYVFINANSIFTKIPITEENYPPDKAINTWIELYFETARGALIDIFSLMEHFRTETTNNVLTFSPSHIKTSGFTLSEPQNGYENYQRIEIAGNLVNTGNYGIISFQITSGLKDTLGNRNDNLLSISIIK